MAAFEENVRIRNLLDRIERSLLDGPIRFGLKGELVVDLDAGWPDYDRAIAAFRRYLVLEAVRRSGGNRSEAARKLNLTRSRLHDLWRQIHGEPPRPIRSDAGETTAARAAESGQEDVDSVDHEANLV